MINLYRSFKPQNNVNAREKFKYQLLLIKNEMTVNTLIFGDFNLDYKKLHDVNYSRRNLFDDFENNLELLELVQLVKFITWSRRVGNVLRESILDHVYVKDPTIISDMKINWLNNTISTFKVKCKKLLIDRLLYKLFHSVIDQIISC